MFNHSYFIDFESEKESDCSDEDFSDENPNINAMDCLPSTSTDSNYNAMDTSSSTQTTITKKTRGRKEVMTAKLSSALDRCKINDRDAVHIIIAVAEALEVEVCNLVVNRSSIKRYREQSRMVLANNIRKTFSTSELNAIILHWDGNLLPDLTGKQIVDRLPIIITNNGSEQLLGVPKLLQSTSKAQAEAVYQYLAEWGLMDHVKALHQIRVSIET